MLFISEEKLAEIVEKAVENIVGETVKLAVQDILNKALTDEEKVVALKKRVEDLEGRHTKVKEELSDVQLKKKQEVRDIEHMVKIHDEKKDLEMEKARSKFETELEHEKAKLLREYSQKEMAMLKEGHEKFLKLLEQGKKDLQDIYTKIIDRMPNVNLAIKQKN